LRLRGSEIGLKKKERGREAREERRGEKWNGEERN